MVILRKRLLLEHLSLDQISQVLSMTDFEKTTGKADFLDEIAPPDQPHIGNRFSFLDSLPDSSASIRVFRMIITSPEYRIRSMRFPG